MAEQETFFNPLDAETHEPAAAGGMKPPGAPMETHEATFSDSHLIDLDLDRYVDDFNRRVIGAYQDGKSFGDTSRRPRRRAQLDSRRHRHAARFHYIAPEIPEFDIERCVGCMAA